MHRVDNDKVPRWFQARGCWLAKSVDGICPHCDRETNFPLTKYKVDEDRDTWAASSNCPACGEECSFWIITPYKGSAAGHPAAICMWPVPRGVRSPAMPLGDIPDSVVKDYESAINVLNSGEWNAATVCCRRLMEGLMHDVLPESLHNKALFQQLTALPEHVDLAEPLRQLADGVRLAGNLGAHFGSGHRADGEAASLVLDFVEYFLEYLYGLPKKVFRLHEQLQSEDAMKADDQAE